MVPLEFALHTLDGNHGAVTDVLTFKNLRKCTLALFGEHFVFYFIEIIIRAFDMAFSARRNDQILVITIRYEFDLLVFTLLSSNYQWWW